MNFGNPSFKAFIHAEIVPPKKLILFDERDSRHLFEGEVYVYLASYLSQGCYSIDQILEFLEEKISPAEIYYALFRLNEKGFLEEAFSKIPRSIQTLCNLLDISCKKGEDSLQKMIVTIQTYGDVSIDPLRLALRSLSIQTDERDGNFVIAVTDNYRDPKLKERLLRSKKPYLLMKPTRAEVWIGPLFNPGKGPCLECLLEALEKNSFEELYIEHETKKKTPVTISTEIPATMSVLASQLAAQEIFKWIVQGDNGNLEAKILTYHFLQPEIKTHNVIHNPYCKFCGTIADASLKPLELKSQKKIFTDDGGHRIQSPEETFSKYQHLISPITGIIEYLAPTYFNQSNMHTYKASHRMQSLSFQDPAIQKHPRGRSGGKGKSDAQGKTSCLCEAIERYSGIFQGSEVRKRASYLSFKDEAIHPHSLLLFSERQYESKKVWNQECSPFHFIPAIFDEQAEIDWTPVWSLTEKRFKWIPSAICYFSYPFQNKELAFCRGDSNGSAAGNSIEEAILQGFFELIERDSIALWWYSRLKRPEVDLKSFPDPHIDRLVSSYSSLNRKLWVLDLTFDLNIPTFAAISCMDDENQGEILFGFGSHFDPAIALMRSLTEMNQPLLFLSEKSKSPSEDAKERTVRNWIEKEVLKNHPYLSPDENAKKKKRLDYIRFDTLDLKEDVLKCQQIVESKGLEMLVLDQTRPNIKLPVIKVFVPGLRHFWNRFAPGRLYDVPFGLGLVKHKLTEQDLNPIPFFL